MREFNHGAAEIAFITMVLTGVVVGLVRIVWLVPKVAIILGVWAGPPILAGWIFSKKKKN